MSEDFEFNRGTTKEACSPTMNWEALLAKYIGQTVTIFTSSGGESGSGFTGVLMTVNCAFVRLLTRIGPAPGCALGNSCSNFSVGGGNDPGFGTGCCGGFGPGMSGHMIPSNMNSAQSAGGWDSIPVYSVGSVTDIPITSIVSFVHSAI
ncbi:hypothetical protein [Ruminiclostridium papyrosolvens]|uniref:Uncharacterized protein n=1 Tax=Ruminiclostridium papyrosolvens C7 TaxID=1330534 RepID=U4QWX9_9FIRM|nr:hypothetical protein [Ruminiclostridium papyrosolvens]EPR08023.1 hypothetical protein L323_18790 [Ruminiclostridium papyrosolvens C7]